MRQSTLLHDGWTFARADQVDGAKIGFSKTEWLAATVPGHVHTDLMANGIIPDPHHHQYEQGVQWIDEHAWVYRMSFHWSPTSGLDRRVLRFEGLDTIATVTLNGSTALQSENMFVPFEIDVTNLLVVGDNELEVRFDSASKLGLERQVAYFEAENFSEDVPRFPDRSFVRKIQCMFGWDWGPRLVSCGIWKPVTLEEFSGRLVDVLARSKAVGKGFSLTVESAVEGSITRVEHSLIGPEGETVDSWTGDGSRQLKNVTLWSPSDPATYMLFSMAYDHDGHVVDHLQQYLGFKTFELRQEQDEFGRSYEFYLNGEPFWARGANWIPDDSFPSRLDRAWLRKRLEAAKAMGMNMLRVWGGGMYESDDFYNLCDEIGLLVWQDFPFGCAYYPENDAFAQQVELEARANVRRLRNHPSLAMWCGNNENQQMHDQAWGGIPAPRFYGDRYYAQLLPEVLGELDPDRPYVEGSPIGKDPNDPKSDSNCGGYGDQHCWDVWHGRGDWKLYADSKARFSSEFGFSASCSERAWSVVFGKPFSEIADLPQDHPTLRWHDKTAKGYDTYLGYIKLHYPAPESLADLVYFSQLNQRDAFQYGIEHYRRSEFCKGTLIWQLNDIWPVQSWAVMDSQGQWKAAAHHLTRIYADQMLSLVRDGETMHVYVINDSRETLEDQVTIRAVSTVQVYEEYRRESVDIRLAPFSRQRIGSLSLNGLNTSETAVWATSDFDETWKLLLDPKDMRFAKPDLEASMWEGGVLSVSASGPLYDVWFDDPTGQAEFETNFLSWAGPDQKLISVSGRPGNIQARSLAGPATVKYLKRPDR